VTKLKGKRSPEKTIKNIKGKPPLEPAKEVKSRNFISNKS
jgi:hypothetical protein